MLSHNIDPFELCWGIVFKILKVMGALLPFIPIANYWQWVTSSVANLAITTGLFIGSVIFAAQFSIAVLAATDTLDLNYAGENLEMLNMVLIVTFVIVTPIIIMGSIYAHALPMNEKGCYSSDKLFSFDAQEIPTLKSKV
jgi:hypothetical protein